VTVAPSFLYASRLAELARQKDPLAHFRCSSEGQELVVRHVADCTEVYAHAAQRSGKSTIGAALTADFTKGHGWIMARDGSKIVLPVLRPPVRWVLGFDSYKLGGASVMHSLRSMLGVEGEDYHEDMGGGAAGCPSVVRVRHSKSQGENGWSTIYVFPYDGVRPRSMELDGWWCDEPPPILYLEALRSRLGAKRALRGYITATPLERKTWGPIKVQYPLEENQLEGDRVRVRWSVFDNEALSPTVQESLRQRAAGSAYEKAMLYGHHVDAEGDCPWSADLLDRWHARTRRGELELLKVTDEKDRPEGRERYQAFRVVEYWERCDPNGVYLATLDASSGIRKADHSPSGVHIWNLRTRSLAARYGQIAGLKAMHSDLQPEWNGYIGSYGLGWIGAGMMQRYVVGGTQVLCAPEVGPWQAGTLRALRDAGHRRFVYETSIETPGQQATRIGFLNSDKTRPKFFAAIEEGLARDDVTILSPEVIRCYKDLIVDANNKLVPGAGYHSEDAILSGAALWLMPQYYQAPKFIPTPAETFRQTLRRPAKPRRTDYRPAREKW
jgi:hypothetical protein